MSRRRPRRPFLGWRLLVDQALIGRGRRYDVRVDDLGRLWVRPRRPRTI